MASGEMEQSQVDLRLILGFLLLFFGLVAAVYARPSGAFFLVVTQPGGGAMLNMETIGRAEGRFVWAGRFPWMSVAYSPDSSFPERLRAHGAILVFNHRLAFGCAKEI